MSFTEHLTDGFQGEALRFEWPRPRIAQVTFTRSDCLNAITPEMINELGKAMEICRENCAIALILTGEGRAFCVGAHLKLFRDDTAPIGRTPDQWRDRYIAPMAELFDSFEDAPFPVIAAINGFALGGGAEMALSADFRIMEKNAVFGLPETRIGASPGAGGVQKLIRHVGRTKALQWILLGEHLDAKTVQDHGMLYTITEPEELLSTAINLAEKFTSLSPAAVNQAKKSIYLSEDADRKTARLFGVEALASLMGTDEWWEGTISFVEKRKPNFLNPPCRKVPK